MQAIKVNELMQKNKCEWWKWMLKIEIVVITEKAILFTNQTESPKDKWKQQTAKYDICLQKKRLLSEWLR